MSSVGGSSSEHERSSTDAGHPSDHYELLEVSRNASVDEIKRTYRRQALKWHPDKQDAPNRTFAEERFKLVSEAYQVLSDLQKRAAFDQYGKEGAQTADRAGTGGMTRTVYTGPGGIRIIFSRSGGGADPFFRGQEGSGFRDPFDIFRSFFGREEDPRHAFFNRRAGPAADPDFGFGPFGSFGQHFGPRLDHQHVQQHRHAQEMQGGLDEEEALQEALRQSREEAMLQEAIRESLQHQELSPGDCPHEARQWPSSTSIHL